MRWGPFHRDYKRIEDEIERWARAGFMSQPGLGTSMEAIYATMLRVVREHMENAHETTHGSEDDQ